MNDTPPETLLQPLVTMGVNDAFPCLEGWSPVMDFGNGCDTVRWVQEEARVRLRVAEESTHVSVEIWVPPGGPAAARLTLLDPWVGRQPGYEPWLDVGVRLRPGAWQALDFPLRLFLLQPDSEVDLTLRIEPAALPPASAAAPPGAASAAWPGSAAVRRVGLRGKWIEPRDVVVAVLNWNRADDTLACLRSLRRADLGGAAVLVVDNGSRDGSVAAIRAEFPDQPIFELPENRGYAGGNNAGIRVALDVGAKGVLLLNNDAEVAPDFLEALVWALNSDVSVAAASSAIFRKDHPELLEVAYLDLYFGHGIVCRRGVNALPGDGFNYRRPVDAAIGCCVLISAGALREVGLLDEAYFAYHEEVDWCFRARQAGYTILYEPYSRVWHGGSRSTERDAQPPRAQNLQAREELPTPIPLSWNPVRTYLGARNTVRFIRLHATPQQARFFVASSLYNLPLEFSAALLGQEEALRIGAWTLRRALAYYCFGDAVGRARRWARAAIRLPLLPVALAWGTWRAHRDGRTAQVWELIRGLWDGLRDRPLPLERLGLR